MHDHPSTSDSGGVHDELVAYETALVPAGRPTISMVPTRDAANDTDTTSGMIGASMGIARVRLMVRRYAHLWAPVLVLGETGTGKELVAQALHDESARSHGPFVAVNAAALTGDLAESELMGHERGAFTSAHGPHRGIFEQANGGTLFLDELGELPLPAQAKLLRVLETGDVRRVGAESSRRVRFRFVGATHQNLPRMVREGTFRADLYWRLHVLVIDVPPLRTRIGDVPLLAEHLLARLMPEIGRRMLSEEAVLALRGYGWPGNVRQLANVLRRAGAQTSGRVIEARDVAEALRDEPTSLSREGRALDTETIRTALAECDGRLATAARRLGIPRTTLREHARRLGARIA